MSTKRIPHQRQLGQGLLSFKSVMQQEELLNNEIEELAQKSRELALQFKQ